MRLPVVTRRPQDGGVNETLYQQLAERPRPRPRPQQSNQPTPPGTIHTATIETVDNDRATALLPGAIAP